MAETSEKRVRIAALILSCVGLAIAASSMPLAAQTVSAQQETPSAALSRHMRVLATKPRDFYALIGAGKAALALGDTQSAAGFFGRAEEAWPSSPMPQIGKGAALAHDDDPQAALQYFARAVQMGAAPASFGADRGLAYDLLGRHSEAQADFRAALVGADADEARRRLSLSLAISGQKDEALATLAPLVARGDPAAARCRALVLALTGDTEAARRSLDAALPGSASYMGPFFAKLPALRSNQKAAAVHLGIFPESGQSYASATVPQFTPPAAQPASPPRATATRPATPRPSYQRPNPSAREDRLLSVEQLLKPDSLGGATRNAAPPVQVANIKPITRQAPPLSPPRAPASTEKQQRVWLQLASGANAAALPTQFKRFKSRNRELFDGISGYITEDAERARLLIGPFKNVSDANVFASDLASVRIDAFSWVSKPGQMIRKLPAE